MRARLSCDMDSLGDTKNFFGKRKVCACAWEAVWGGSHLSSVLPGWGEKKRLGKKKEVAAIAVEQRTLVRHRLTFHRNPLASSAGGRVSRPRLRCLMGSGNRDSATVGRGRQRRILESRAAGAFTLLGGCSAPARSLDVASAPTRGSARERPRASPFRRPGTWSPRWAHARRILPRVAHRRRNVVAEYAAARNANGNYSGANRIFDASRDWSAHWFGRTGGGYPSFLLRFSPSLTLLLFPFGHFLLVFFTPAILSFRRLISRTARNLFPFHLDPILYTTVRSQACTPKHSRARQLRSHGYGRSAHDPGKIGSRLQW